MQRKILYVFFYCLVILLFLSGCIPKTLVKDENNRNKDFQEKDRYAEIIERYRNQIPHEWGENVTGVKTRLDTNDKVVALTFDACGSIVIFHMNHPEKDTAEGIMKAIPELKKRGFKFVKLEDYKLK